MDVNQFSTNIGKCVTHLAEDLSHIHTGRANTELIDGVVVEAYGTNNPIKNVASISVADSRSLVVAPWDQTLKEAIVKGIDSSNLGFFASIEGAVVRIKIPELTGERRDQFVKVMKEKVEQARISVRNVRHEAMKEIDGEVSEGLPKDEGERLRVEVEKKTKETNEQIEKMKEQKEKELMTI
ncbi:ribosome recycling factor [Candidatus Dojkabacteria bacterium]|jgi:ribosome recycling factor|nr:ribosome recycling factor [Candidatus Dojkabacteria bacterium]